MDGCLRAVVETSEAAFALVEEDRALFANLYVVARADFGTGATTDAIIIYDVLLCLVVGYLGFA